MTATAYRIVPVPPELVADLWPTIEALVEQGVAAGPGDRWAEDYRVACAEGRCQLWLVGEEGPPAGIAITEVLRFPRRRVAHIDLLAGDGLPKWQAALDAALCDWARQRGCQAIQGWAARKGWLRQIDGLGYRQFGAPMRKEL